MMHPAAVHFLSLTALPQLQVHNLRFLRLTLRSTEPAFLNEPDRTQIKKRIDYGIIKTQ